MALAAPMRRAALDTRNQPPETDSMWLARSVRGQPMAEAGAGRSAIYRKSIETGTLSALARW